MKCVSIVKKKIPVTYWDLELRVPRIVARDQVSPLLVLTVDYMKENNSFMPILSIRIVLSRNFYKLIFFFLEFVIFSLRQYTYSS